MDWVAWLRQLDDCLRTLREIDLGYPQGENVALSPPDPASLEALIARAGLDPRAPIIAFYRACGGLSLPDVYNGYFIGSPDQLLGTLVDEPRRLADPFSCDILVFGWDGGGGRFALGTTGDGQVLHLGDGAVRDGVFDGEDAVRVVAPDFPSFLERLLADVEAFVRDDRKWEYLA